MLRIFSEENAMLRCVDRVIATRSPKRVLFRHIKKFLPETDPQYKEILRAHAFAKRACRNRMREDGSTAFGHGVSVALIAVVCVGVKDPAQIMADLLHDVVEDIKGKTHAEIEAEFGQRVAYYVRWASKDPREDFPNKTARDKAYSERFLDAPAEVLENKLPDVLHNLRTLFACDIEKQKRIVEIARRIYLPLAKKHNVLSREIEAAIIRVETGWARSRDRSNLGVSQPSGDSIK